MFVHTIIIILIIKHDDEDAGRNDWCMIMGYHVQCGGD